jgi:hypothetical protein
MRTTALLGVLILVGWGCNKEAGEQAVVPAATSAPPTTVAKDDGLIPKKLRGSFQMVSGEVCSKKNTTITLSKRNVVYASTDDGDCNRSFKISAVEEDDPIYTLKVDGKDDFSVTAVRGGVHINSAPNWRLKGQFSAGGEAAPAAPAAPAAKTAEKPAEIAADGFNVGARVSCNWQDGGIYYNGEITRTRGNRIHISYDDGDQEDTTTSKCRLAGGGGAAAPAKALGGGMTRATWDAAKKVGDYKDGSAKKDGDYKDGARKWDGAKKDGDYKDGARKWDGAKKLGDKDGARK